MIIRPYLELARLNRPIGIWLLGWPIVWALWLASHNHPHWTTVVIFLLGVVLMRSAGCVFNDIADQRWDGQVERTANRPLVTGAVSLSGAWIWCGILLFCAALLLLALTSLAILWAFPALLLALIYPYTKRWIQAPQFVLGLAFASGIPMVFADMTGGVSDVAKWLMAATVLWALAYDTAYAMTDLADDVRIGIRSTARWWGRFVCEGIFLCELGMLFCLFKAGKLAGLNC